GKDYAQGSFSYPTFEWLRARATQFSHMFTWTEQRIEVGEGDGMEWLSADFVSTDYFTGLGAVASLGRTLSDERGQPAVALLGHPWWQRRLDADPRAVGRTIRLGGLSFRIVGVMPEGFFGAAVGSAPDVFLPIDALSLREPNLNRLTMRNASWLPL